MAAAPTRALAVVGMGVIGRSWLRAFTRAGFETRIWDADPTRVDAAWSWLKADLKLARKRQGLRKAVARSQKELVARCATLEEAVEGAAYVQECGATEQLEAKQRLFTDLDAVSGPRAILATSSAGFDIAAVAADLPGRDRCLIAHPVHLPHVVPAVEVCAGPETDPAVVRRTLRLHARLGQTPVYVKRFVPGLIGDRLRAALVREELSLLAGEVADLAAVEETLRNGLGLLWTVLGPIGVTHTGSEGGLRAHFDQQAGFYEGLWDELATGVDLTPELIDRLGRAMDALSRGIPLEDQQLWRDEMVERIRRLKATHPLGGPVMD